MTKVEGKRQILRDLFKLKRFSYQTNDTLDVKRVEEHIEGVDFINAIWLGPDPDTEKRDALLTEIV